MKIVFVSNFYNHHQKTLSEALCQLTDGNYYFIATCEMYQEQKEIGYKQESPDFVRFSYKSEEELKECKKLIDEADVVLFGSAPEKLIRGRIKSGKLILKYSERPLRFGKQYHKYLIRLIRWHWRNPVNKPIYLLAASAFCKEDYKMFGLFPNKKYKWGYFPPTITYDNIDVLKENKNFRKILWVGRFHAWKRPMIAINVAKMLKDAGYNFELEFIGTGLLKETLQDAIIKNDLQSEVKMSGVMSPEQVREKMEKAGILMFTSSFREGWGAVVNEAMNSCCCVTAYENIGSIPFLIKNGENGYAFRDEEHLFEILKDLLDNPDKQWEAGKAAYPVVTEKWNGYNAAKRLIEFSNEILSGNKYPDIYEDGPCSKC